MLLLARDHVARAHRAVFHAAALANPDAPQHRAREIAEAFWIMKVSVGLPWLIVFAEAKLLVGAERVHNLTGIHFALRIPNRLKFAERLHQLWAKGLWQKVRACLSIAMLPRHGSAVFH